jgi:hypothetical protein
MEMGHLWAHKTKNSVNGLLWGSMLVLSVIKGKWVWKALVVKGGKRNEGRLVLFYFSSGGVFDLFIIATNFI